MEGAACAVCNSEFGEAKSKAQGCCPSYSMRNLGG